MTPAYDTDDDAATSIQSANVHVLNGLPPGTIDDGLISKVLPRADKPRSVPGQDFEQNYEDYLRRQPQSYLSKPKDLMDLGAFEDEAENYKDPALEKKDGMNSTGPRKATRPGRETPELRRPFSPLSRVDMVPQGPDSRPQTRPERESFAVPKRHSSRPDQAVKSPDRMARQRGISNHPPRADEIEAARRLLARAPEADGYTIREEGKETSAGVNSATPPPIRSRQRRVVIYDDSEEEEENADSYGDENDQDYHEYHNEYRNGDRNKDVASTPATSIYQPTESGRPSRAHHRYTLDHPTSSRTSSRQSLPPPTRSRVAENLTAHKRELRTPVLDQNRLYLDAEPPAIGQRHPRNQQPLRPTYMEISDEEEETVRDYSDKSGLDATSTLDYGPAKTGMGPRSDDSMSISKQSTSKHSMMSSESARGIDFFGQGIFQVVLHNPITVHQLLKFAEARLCSEGVEFLKKLEEYQKVLNDLTGVMTTIRKGFLSDDSSKQINVNGELRNAVHSEMKSLATKTLPRMETLFSDLQESVEHDVFMDIYPRFVRYQMALSATRALATNSRTYQGLGDCFCLTNPGLADNPIVFASDGFIKVTGYTRPEIIPRNCRFLQGVHTDREPVRRLKAAIEARKESVELLLNYKKNGDPFWNLLYVAPLYNESGMLSFFLGGQINCSTTIHTNADIMKVLSSSSNDNVEEAAKKPPVLHRSTSAPSARRAFLKALGVKVDDSVPSNSAIDPGMEGKLLHKLEGRDLNYQMKEFYTAYSKYLVVAYDSFIIRFYSEGVLDMLHPVNNTVGLVAGQDIFRFLKQNMVNHQSEYKTRVRTGMRAGAPVSLEVRLQTRRSAQFRGDEKFMTHWTPLKDEKSAVHWIVVTMAPTIQ
ncbi:hypothetical protein CGRA01v4_00421 [Colletotrichum graminicola]|uniref:RGS domain-containing protein n=1 Tax=Colletotrichum graminicola (strain M1.001 / M2 / FGSC 10212) TaxID=645133 RepID=E3QH33_COLGM|nr:uncharacterized protein GLRG_05339 [Colletotrichum graminicola M1.001]EFQ30195.1 hypothetical protein GLRG_05339 [Colletotrichum graminicola M1.001]WDK09143.1 hypothetical protein CGRA01v4_00421 [Colletotrichum graminicola]